VAGDLRELDVHVLPGGKFHWADPGEGEAFIRLALGRPREVVREGAEVIRAYLEDRAR
jgi:aspartate/methionine/tyrosine aminotransferase